MDEKIGKCITVHKLMSIYKIEHPKLLEREIVHRLKKELNQAINNALVQTIHAMIQENHDTLMCSSPQVFDMAL